MFSSSEKPGALDADLPSCLTWYSRNTKLADCQGSGWWPFPELREHVLAANENSSSKSSFPSAIDAIIAAPCMFHATALANRKDTRRLHAMLLIQM